MNVDIKLKTNKEYKWYSNKEIFCKGYLFDEKNNLYTENDLIRYFKGINNLDSFKNKLNKANGFFSVIINKKNDVYLSVDRIRSIPLFYKKEKDKISISDNPRCLQNEMENNYISQFKKDEFLLSGFISGEETLFSNIKQVQAGEFILLTQKNKNIDIYNNRYYKYCHKRYYDISEKELLEKFDNTMENIFERLIKFASGKKIIVPLSGGYDSRLIVLMLKKMGYKNILTFSYGNINNEEAQISKYIAEELNMPWEFIEYTNDDWYNWFHSKEMSEYLNYADGLTALPHIQDWPAVMKLKNKIDINSVFVSGISADLNTGGFIKKYPNIYNKGTNIQELVDLILKYSYSLFPFKNIEITHRNTIKKKIHSIVKSESYCGSMGEKFECWVSTEKVAKFVFNSVRVYEYFNFNWWAPYWDEQFIDFWYNVPFKYRKGQNLYKSYIKKLTQELGVFKDKDPLFRDGQMNYKSSFDNSFSISKSLKYLIKNYCPKFVMDFLKKKQQIKKIENSPLNIYGIIDKDKCKKIIKQKHAKNINSIFVYEYINEFLNKEF